MTLSKPVKFHMHWRIWAVAGLGAVLIGAIVATAMHGSGQERARHLQAFKLTSVSEARQLGEHARQSMGHIDLALRSVLVAFRAEARKSKTGKVAGKSKKADADRWRPSPRMYRRLRRLAAAVPQISSIRIIDATGTVRYSSLRHPARPIPMADTSFFKAIVDDKKRRHVGTETVGAKKPKTFITVSRRLTNRAGKLVGMVTARVHLSYFARLYANAATSPSGAAVLMSPTGTVLASHPPRVIGGEQVAGRAAETVPFLKDLPKVKVGRNRVRGFSTGEAVGAVYRVGGHNLTLAVMAPTDVALARWETDFWQRLMMAGAIALLVCGFLLFLSWQVLGRAQQAATVKPVSRPKAERRSKPTSTTKSKPAEKSPPKFDDGDDQG